MFRLVTFPAVSRAIAVFEYTNNLSTIVNYMLKYATQITKLCTCGVFRIQSDVSPDDQAQQAGRQQQFERWDAFSAESPLPFEFLVHLNYSS